MTHLLKYYRNGFYFEKESDLQVFINECVNVVDNYLSFLVYKGKIFLPFGLNTKDAAIDITAEIFTRENNCLIKFKRFFLSIECSPQNEKEAEKILHKFLLKITRNNLFDLFGKADHNTHVIIRSINRIINEKKYYTSWMLSDKFIHRQEIDFNKYEYCEREMLYNLVFKYRKLKYSSSEDFIGNVFEIIESQNDYLKAVSYYDLIYLYKYFYLNEYYFSGLQTEFETSVHYKFMFDSIKSKYMRNLNAYLFKKNFSEGERESMYNVIEEFTKNLLDGGIKKSPSELTKQFFTEKNYSKFINKVEYCLYILMDSLTTEIRKENLIGK